MKLLGSTKNKITKDKNERNVPQLEITAVVLVHCNIVNIDYQHKVRLLYAFVPNKSFGQFLDISPRKHFLKKSLIQRFHILEYGLLIKILNT